LIKDIQKALGVTVVFVTHDVNEALSLSDQVAFLEKGRLTQIATPNDLYNQPKNKTIAQFLGACNLIEGDMKDGVFRKETIIIEAGGEADGQIVLMIRPHQITITPQGNFEIERITQIGKEIKVEVRHDEMTLMVELQGDCPYKVGQKVGLEFLKGKGHFINKEGD
jgi:ABC-type sugar transport system ATPase subunit